MKVYKALVDGAYDGLSGQALLDYVRDRCPGVTDKLVISASTLALGDADVTDPDVLRAIYELATDRRLLGRQAEPARAETNGNKKAPGS